MMLAAPRDGMVAQIIPVPSAFASVPHVNTRRHAALPTTVASVFSRHHASSLSSLPSSAIWSIRGGAGSSSSSATSLISLFPKAVSQYLPYILPLIIPLLLLRPYGLSRSLLIASSRALLQLSLLGGLVLSFLFHQSNPAIVLPYLAALGAIAAREASTRCKQTYPRLKRHALLSLLVGCGGSLFMANLPTIFSLTSSSAAASVTRSSLDAKRIIPLWGLVLGNSVTALALLTSNLITALTESKSNIDMLLARGATVTEAISPTLTSSLTSALTPTINSLSVCGLVHIPGVMSGSILAGMDPGSAGRSQANVMALLASASSLSAYVMSRLITRTAFDSKWQRICESWGKLVTAGSSRKGHTNGEQLSNAKGALISESTKIKSTRINSIDDETRPIVMEASSISVPRTNYNVSFTLRKGDILGITGQSGAGKTSLLRRLALLEGQNNGNNGKMLLHGSEPEVYGCPNWRRRITWVSQDRATVAGTTMDLHRQIRGFSSVKNSVDEAHGGSNIKDIATKELGLNEELLNRSLSSLSGGEAARSILSSALALEGDVLLLDEPTASLDPRSEALVESALKKRGSTIIIVTHSREQLERFCTHHIDLS